MWIAHRVNGVLNGFFYLLSGVLGIEFQELFQGVAVLQELEDPINGHPGAGDARLAAHNAWGAGHGRQEPYF